MNQPFLSKNEIEELTELTLPIFIENNISFSYVFGDDSTFKVYYLGKNNFGI